MDAKGFTIDSETTRDIDDSIWVESDSRGWTVTVCIANVAAAIAKDSTFDATARRRVETLYFAGSRNTPMIPRRFSEGSCSLFEGEERLVMAIRIRLDHTLEPQGLPRIDTSKPASRLAMALVDKRRSKGAFVLYDMTHGWVMTESGHIRQLKDVRETVGNIIVQELMILTNQQLARFCLEKDIPVPFRNHTASRAAPPRERMMELLEQGMQGDVQRYRVARDSFLMVMNKARYGATLEGHYGLNLPAYLHGTYPIRRYADLVTQRQIFGYLNGRNIPYSFDDIEEVCEHINKTIEENASKRSADAIEKANRRAEKSIATGRLPRLNAKEFERVVKVCVRGDFDSEVAEEFIKRLESDDAAIVDIFQVLLKSGEEWKSTRSIVLKHLASSPHLATSIATVAQQSGEWSAPKFLTRRSGEENSLIHLASVTFDNPPIKTDEISASSLKTAKQRAIVAAFALHLEEPIPDWPKDSEQSSDSKAPKLPSRDSSNPIGELMEYCQSRSIDLPEFESERSGGSDHEPVFTVSCKAAGLHVKSKPMKSKKAAKKAAAKRAIQLILERS